METFTKEELESAVRKARYSAQENAYIDMLSHIVTNDLIDAYNIRDVMDCYSIEPQELKQYTLDYHKDDDVMEYFKELYEEYGLLCGLCESELDEDELCSNTDCEDCDDAYLSEAQIKERENES